ncbi:quinone oxidoreductase [Peniophora sp. CONT]|nr:quinone oxidoreductase [Peniophora sp. CONT]
MRAILVKDGKGPAENLYIGEAPEPALGEGQVKVQVKAFGLNRAETSQRQGAYPPPPGVTDIIGLEFAGVVSEVGAGSRWKKGQDVLGLAAGGSYAEHIVVPEGSVMPKPEHLSWAEAGAVPEAFLTAYQALKLVAEMKEGDNVLVHAGASGVGIAAIQLARYFGAKTVTATASSKEKLDWLLSLPAGATHVANYRTEDFADVVKDATGGHGADVVIDMVGQSHWERNIKAMAVDGRMTILAFMSGNEVPKVNLVPILIKRLRIQGSTLRARDVEYKARLVQEFSKVLPDLTGSAGEGKLRVYIHKVHPWNEIVEATREMEANKNSGKIVCEVV